MIVEWLKFWVNPTIRQQFLAQDAQIWTPALAAQPGFLRKEYWQPPQADELIIVVHWQSCEQWKAIPVDFLAATEIKFAQAVGVEQYKMLESLSFPVIARE